MSHSNPLKGRVNFDEAADEQVDAPSLKPAQRFDSEWLPAADEPVVSPSKPKRSIWPWLLLAMLAMALLQAGWLVWSWWQAMPVLGGVASVLLLTTVYFIVRMVWREWRTLAQLKRREHQRQQCLRLLQAPQRGEALPLLEAMVSQWPAAQSTWPTFLAQQQSYHNDQELLQLFNHVVLQPLDKRAEQQIQKFASEAALMVALSPLALVDMALVFWRGLRLLNELNALYGLQLGYWARIRLIKMLMHNLIWVGATELVTDLSATALSAELTGKLSARAAQGVSAGILTARLGLTAQQLVRPLPLPNKASLLSTFSKGIAKQLLSLGKAKVNDEAKAE